MLRPPPPPRAKGNIDANYIPLASKFRSNWVTDPESGAISATILSPTNIPSDPPLAAKGVTQAQELAEHMATVDPTPTRIYTSPFYRCLQTIDPVAEKLGLTDIRAENGIGEWYGVCLSNFFFSSSGRQLLTNSPPPLPFSLSL